MRGADRATIITMTRWGWIAIIAIGCGHAAPPAPIPAPTPAVAIDAGAIDAPKPLDEDLPRLAERGVAMFSDWARALAEAGEDCAVATAKINAVADSYADVIIANAKVMRAGRVRVTELRAALDAHAENLDATAKAIVESPVMAKCHDDPAFARAIDRVGGEQ